jgi:uncharacterized protein (TIGR03435 family)
MKRRNQSIRQSLDQAFVRFRKMPPPEVGPGWERIRDRSHEGLGGVFESLDFDKGSAPMTSATRMSQRLLVAAACTAFVVAIVVAMILSRSHGPAVIDQSEGGLHRVISGRTEALRAGEKIAMGETVRSDGTSSGTLVLADGSRVEMRTRSDLRLEPAPDGVTIHLNSGGVIVNAAKQRPGRHLYVQTKDVTVSVVGTVFLVNAEAEGSRVAVIEGEVRVTQGGTERSLRPGEEVSTSPKLETLPVKKEITWSHQAERHMALLQQSTAAKTATTSQEPTAAPESFEVASIRLRRSGDAGGGRGGGVGGSVPACGGGIDMDPGRVRFRNYTLYRLITEAYGKNCYIWEQFEGDPLSGGPAWVRSDSFDIEATIPAGPSDYVSITRNGATWIEDPGPRVKRMLQTLLTDRFKLVLRHETKELPGFVVSVARGGAKLSTWKDGDRITPAGLLGSRQNGGQWSAVVAGNKVSMAGLVISLESATRRPVLDQTGITVEFNYNLEFAPLRSEDIVNKSLPVLSSPSLFTALEEQLGLKLEPAKIPVEVLVIDHVERPSEN